MSLETPKINLDAKADKSNPLERDKAIKAALAMIDNMGEKKKAAEQVIEASDTSAEILRKIVPIVKTGRLKEILDSDRDLDNLDDQVLIDFVNSATEELLLGKKVEKDYFVNKYESIKKYTIEKYGENLASIIDSQVLNIFERQVLKFELIKLLDSGADLRHLSKEESVDGMGEAAIQLQDLIDQNKKGSVPVEGVPDAVVETPPSDTVAGEPEANQDDIPTPEEVIPPAQAAERADETAIEPVVENSNVVAPEKTPFVSPDHFLGSKNLTELLTKYNELPDNAFADSSDKFSQGESLRSMLNLLSQEFPPEFKREAIKNFLKVIKLKGGFREALFELTKEYGTETEPEKVVAKPEVVGSTFKLKVRKATKDMEVKPVTVAEPIVPEASIVDDKGETPAMPLSEEGELGNPGEQPSDIKKDLPESKTTEVATEDAPASAPKKVESEKPASSKEKVKETPKDEKAPDPTLEADKKIYENVGEKGWKIQPDRTYGLDSFDIDTVVSDPEFRSYILMFPNAREILGNDVKLKERYEGFVKEREVVLGLNEILGQKLNNELGLPMPERFLESIAKYVSSRRKEAGFIESSYAGVLAYKVYPEQIKQKEGELLGLIGGSNEKRDELRKKLAGEIEFSSKIIDSVKKISRSQFNNRFRSWWNPTTLYTNFVQRKESGLGLVKKVLEETDTESRKRFGGRFGTGFMGSIRGIFNVPNPKFETLFETDLQDKLHEMESIQLEKIKTLDALSGGIESTIASSRESFRKVKEDLFEAILPFSELTSGVGEYYLNYFRYLVSQGEFDKAGQLMNKVMGKTSRTEKTLVDTVVDKDQLAEIYEDLNEKAIDKLHSEIDASLSKITEDTKPSQIIKVLKSFTDRENIGALTSVKKDIIAALRDKIEAMDQKSDNMKKILLQSTLDRITK